MSQKAIFLLITGIVVMVIAALGAGLWFAIEENKIVIIDSIEQIQQSEQNRPAESIFGQEYTLSVGQKISFSDGLQLTLVKIGDSRCKPGVVCFWAGELTAHLHATGGNIKSGTEFSLGTERVKTYAIGGYTFILNSATETTATITIVKKAP